MTFIRNCSVSFDVFTSNVALVFLNLTSAIIAICSNVLILIAFYQTPSLRSISNFFLVSLAVSDLLVGLAVNPVYVVIHLTGVSFDFSRMWPVRLAENWLCVQSVITSTFNLTAISLDRYIAQTVTQQRCIFGATFIWTFSVLFASIRFLIHDPKNLPVLWIATTILMVLVPLLVICYCYFHIFRAARRQQRQIANLSLANATYDNTVLKNNKAAWTIAIIIGLFVVMWTPSLILSVVDLAMKDSCKRSKLALGWYFATFLSFFSSCCNPWVYATRSHEFRMAFKRVLRPQRNSSSNQEGTALENFRSHRVDTAVVVVSC